VFSGITDPRQPKKIIYQVGDLAFTAIFMFMCGLQARRQIAFLLRGDKGPQQFREVFGAPTCPHGDTLNNAFACMDPAEFQAVLRWMVYCLIRKKVLYRYRLLDRYFLIAIDGAWTLIRKKRHCRKCLTQTKNGKTTYYHMVVEAKLVTPDGFAIPLFTEFVENTGCASGNPHSSKHDNNHNLSQPDLGSGFSSPFSDPQGTDATRGGWPEALSSR
jgi:hypothetical protein